MFQVVQTILRSMVMVRGWVIARPFGEKNFLKFFVTWGFKKRLPGPILHWLLKKRKQPCCRAEKMPHFKKKENFWKVIGKVPKKSILKSELIFLDLKIDQKMDFSIYNRYFWMYHRLCRQKIHLLKKRIFWKSYLESALRALLKFENLIFAVKNR